MKPCPFCGGTKIYSLPHHIQLGKAKGEDTFVGWLIKCYSCGVEVEQTFEIDAVKIWNTRPIEEEWERQYNHQQELDWQIEDALRAENARLKAALEWYADETNWKDAIPGEYHLGGINDVASWFFDNGDRARAALSGDGQ